MATHKAGAGRQVGIRDVARIAGVSVATASLALNGRPGVAEETRRRAVAAAEQLGYRANSQAQALRRGRTTTYGFVVRNFANPFFLEVLSGAQQVAAECGATLLVLDSRYSLDRERRHVQEMAVQRVAGLAIAPVGSGESIRLWQDLRPGAPVTSLGETPLTAEGKPRRGLQASRRRRLNLFRYVVFTLFGLFFLTPLAAMVRFSLEGSTHGSFSLAAWRAIGSYPGLLSAIEITLELAVITCVVVLVLLVPTMIWIRLRVQWISRIFEFLCLLPLTIPAIALVVGLVPIYNRIEHYNLSALQLSWVYAILALPYAYRALSAGLSAIDVKTLSEAARGLGASWLTVMIRVIAPNMWQAILNAMLLSSALVLGEFTIASLLLYINLQVALYDISRATANAGVLFATSAASLLFAFGLLLVLSYVGRRRSRG